MFDVLIEQLIIYFVQLEEELNKAKCILVDGQASSFLPGKAESARHFVLFLFLFFFLLFADYFEEL